MLKLKEEEEVKYMDKEKGRFLGYVLRVEYVITKIKKRYRVSYRLVEEFNPFFSEGHGCLSVSDFRELGSFTNITMAVETINSHMENKKLCDIVKEWTGGS